MYMMDIKGSNMPVEDELIQAVYNENVDRIKGIFSDAGKERARELVNIRDANRDPLLHIAIKKNLSYAFDALMDAGPDLNAPSGPNSAIHIAAMYGRTAMSKKIIDTGLKPRPNFRNAWPSSLASKYHYDELARMLQSWEQSHATHVTAGFLRGGRKSFVRHQIEDRKVNAKYKIAKDKS